MDFFQIFIIIISLIVTQFIKSLTSSSSSSTSSVAAVDTDFPPLQEKYDVFLSFRGEDTRDTFTSHLHKALCRESIETYIDNRLEKGDDIRLTLLEAIEKSKIAVVIFSKDYASSTWCLKELVHILGCKKSHGQIVIPIFYHIDPSHVRKQQVTYALEDRPLKRSRDEVANWRAALEEGANISGFHYSRKTGRTEADFVEEVVQHVLTKLNCESLSDLKGLVGIETKVPLIYANVTYEDVLLKEELDRLTSIYPDRVKIYYALNQILRCGPPPMKKAMAAHLEALGYAPEMQFQF
ncbi:hypothetical protein ACE6H2_022865 [Prunus campanulata]